MVSKKQLQNLARGRAIRKANLMAQQKVRQPQPRRKVRYIRFPRNQPILNPRLMSDLDVTTTDNNFNKQISAKGETLFTNLDDMIPKAIQGRKKQ